MKCSAVISVAVLSLLSAQAWADPHKGVYFGVGAGQVRSNVASKASNTYYVNSTEEKSKSATALKGFAGYTFGYFGFEAAYFDAGSYKYSGDSSGTYSHDEFATKAFALMATGTVPMGENFALHGKLGAARVKTSYTCHSLCVGSVVFDNNTVNSTTPVVGVGISWAALKHLALRVDFESIRGARFRYGDASLKANYEVLTFGAEARF